MLWRKATWLGTGRQFIFEYPQEIRSGTWWPDDTPGHCMGGYHHALGCQIGNGVGKKKAFESSTFVWG